MYKNFKKLLALGLSISMVAGLTACGGSGDSAQQPAADTGNEAKTDAGSDVQQGGRGKPAPYGNQEKSRRNGIPGAA